MPEETTPQVSAGAEGATAVAVADKPSPTPEVGAEKGSTAPQVSQEPAQEHRETTASDIVDLLARMDPKARAQAIKSLDPQWVRDHPYVHQVGQSSFDRGRNKGAEETRAALENQRERERLKAMDSLDLGEEMKRRFEQEEQLGPLYQRVRQEVEQQYADELGKRYTVGYQEAYREKATALANTRKKYGVSQAEWDQLVRGSANDDEVNDKLIVFIADKQADERAQKKLEAELAKLKGRQEREQQVEEGAGESSPELGGGNPAGSDREFLAAYAGGHSADHARARKLLGM